MPRWMYTLPTKQVCCNLGHSLPEPLTRDFLSRWISYWSTVRSEIPAVSSQHFSLHSSLLLQKSMSQEIVSSSAAIFEASITFYVQTGLCLSHMICYTPNSWCQELSSSNFWHQSSLNTRHCAAFSQITHFPGSVLSLKFSFLLSPFQLLFPFVFLLSDLAYSWSWFSHGRDQMISAGKTAFFLHIALNPAIIQLPVLQ